MFMYLEPDTEFLALQAIRKEQDHAVPIQRRTRCLATPNLSLQKSSLLITQLGLVRHTPCNPNITYTDPKSHGLLSR